MKGGSIRSRGEGRWEVSFDLPRAANGRRRRRTFTIHGTKRQAVAALATARTQTYVANDAGNITLGTYLEQWLVEYASPNLKATTVERYRSGIHRHLIPHLGERRLIDVTPRDVAQLATTCRAEGLSSQSVRHNHMILRDALEYACRLEMIPRNPAALVKPPRVMRPEIQALDSDQARQLLNAAKETPIGPVVFLALQTGARLGELLALRWEDVDFERSLMSIRRTASYLPRRGVQITATKTHRSNRAVLLSAATIGFLKELKEAQETAGEQLGDVYEDHGMVFADELGDPLLPNFVQRNFKRLITNLGFPPTRFHDLRHTHASLALAAGAHPKAVSERLGHSTVSLTLDRYSHVLPTVQDETASRVSDLLTGD